MKIITGNHYSDDWKDHTVGIVFNFVSIYCERFWKHITDSEMCL